MLDKTTTVACPGLTTAQTALLMLFVNQPRTTADFLMHVAYKLAVYGV